MNKSGDALSKSPMNWGSYNCHDPSIFKASSGTYYIFSTDTKSHSNTHTFPGGCQIRTSEDLVQWTWKGTALDGVPSEAYAWTSAQGLWAPEVAFWDNVYHLYYSASQFGKNQSFIGLATSNSIEGPWEEQGVVVKTKNGVSAPNAIDANIVFDKQEEPYLCYGSFFGGIYLKKLDRQTGKPLSEGDGSCIAKRDNITREGAVEGPYIYYHSQHDYYYLFVSYDSLFTNYHIRVGRARSIEGPYFDSKGFMMTNDSVEVADEVGEKILSGYCFSDETGWMAPGHNSILDDGEQTFLVHHARELNEKDLFSLHIRELKWLSDGWPVVAIERYKRIPDDDMSLSPVGMYEGFLFGNAYNGIHQSVILNRESINALTIDEEPFELVGKNEENQLYRSLLNNENTMECIEFKGWDWELQQPTWLISGRLSNKTSFSFKKRVN
ncbi:arabinan endo-1,5-alpha-L-arabinosidase [Salipaludibacillus neizhouensis]|uniref:Arabinan endo-1,5-alpha-L-arabinosidase n=1 Tax=Salipaludibacillus neizhouensis TaxID=885475 RepID=A0A3A9K7M5_9BACI|nr:arabinan endo-1,5-alpha-L-arabinosidase [Salipaludibacillus neizhouensis]RKL66840.1 arabinan endo-1,5-alpha-L-arabinosidase [Salipaludibacillus neizhouensis]